MVAFSFVQFVKSITERNNKIQQNTNMKLVVLAFPISYPQRWSYSQLWILIWLSYLNGNNELWPADTSWVWSRAQTLKLWLNGLISNDTWSTPFLPSVHPSLSSTTHLCHPLLSLTLHLLNLIHPLILPSNRSPIHCHCPIHSPSHPYTRWFVSPVLIPGPSPHSALDCFRWAQMGSSSSGGGAGWLVTARLLIRCPGCS